MHLYTVARVPVLRLTPACRPVRCWIAPVAVHGCAYGSVHAFADAYVCSRYLPAIPTFPFLDLIQSRWF